MLMKTSSAAIQLLKNSAISGFVIAWEFPAVATICIQVSLGLLIKKGGFGPVQTPNFSWAEPYSLN